MTPAELLSAVTSTVSYLRITARVDADPELDWLPCGELVSQPDRLLDVVLGTADGRGAAARDDVAMSLFAQAYAFRIAATAIGGWLLSNQESTFDVRPANMAISLGRHRPNAVALNHVKLARTDLFTALFDEHLSPFVNAAHTALGSTSASEQRIGRTLLWSNMAAGCASAFGGFHGAAADPGGRAAVRRAADTFYSGAPSQLVAGGRWIELDRTAGEPGWFFERSACCLLYQLAGPDGGSPPAKCEDCSLLSAEERAARYAAATAAEGAS